MKGHLMKDPAGLLDDRGRRWIKGVKYVRVEDVPDEMVLVIEEALDIDKNI